MTTANIRELAEFELIKTLDAMDKNDAPLDSAIEYVHPYTESGQRAGYWSIKLSDKVTLRAYCSGDSDGFNVRGNRFCLYLGRRRKTRARLRPYLANWRERVSICLPTYGI
jgi:hypothetical protein